MVISLSAQKVQLERIDQWKFDHEPLVYIGNTYISKDNSIIGIIRDVWGTEITKTEIKQFAGYGDGPNQVIFPTMIFSYGNDIVIHELAGRIKIFTKKEGGYTFKNSRWLKKKELPFIPRQGVFFENRIFIAGPQDLKQSQQSCQYALISVYDEKGNLIKLLMEKNWESNQPHYGDMIYYISVFKNNQLVFAAENEPSITLISPKSMEVVKEVKLQVPSFYKKMPEKFYTSELTSPPGKVGDPGYFLKMMETYKTGYSMIYNLNFDANQNALILQMRTCDKKLKRYAILVYNADTFKLEHTLYTDDYLVGVKDGKFYCFANGNPGWDGDIDDVVFNIYRVKK